MAGRTLNKVMLMGHAGKDTEMAYSNSGMAIAKHNLEKPVCRDSDDDNILAAAVGGSCDCIITGDEDLLVLKAYEGIDILSPRDFLTKER